MVDANDNSPQFEHPEIEKLISESAAVGTTIRLASATDDDFGNFDVKSYRIAAADPSEGDDAESVAESFANLPFKLNVISNSFGLLIPELSLTKELDREIKSSYKFKIEAVDGGKPVSCCCCCCCWYCCCWYCYCCGRFCFSFLFFC